MPNGDHIEHSQELALLRQDAKAAWGQLTRDAHDAGMEPMEYGLGALWVAHANHVSWHRSVWARTQHLVTGAAGALAAVVPITRPWEK